MSLDNARAIIARLQPLQGPAASGQLLVHATGADVSLPYGSFAVPVVDGALTWQAQVFVSKNAATEDGSWTVTSAGSLVPVEALQGGPVGNQATGTPYRWFLPVAGVEATSEASGAISGGSALGTIGALRQVRYYKDLSPTTSQASVEQFFRSTLSDFPGAVLAWQFSRPQDGAFAATPGARASRVAGDRMAFRHSWRLWLVTSRLDGADLRQHEGDILREDVVGRLFNAKTARGLWVSKSPGIEIQDMRVASATPTGYVDQVDFSTLYVQCAVSDLSYNDWLKTRIRVQTDPQPPDPAIDLPDVTVSMS